MSIVGARNSSGASDRQRCGICDADVLFLTVCPACGAPVGSRVPVLTDAASSERPQPARVSSFAEVARAQSRTPLPEQLIRAWEPPGPRRTPPRPDEWTSGGKRRHLRRTTSVPRSRLSVVLLIALVVLGGSIAALQLSNRAGHGRLGPPMLTSPRIYDMSGNPFQAAFPSHPTTRALPLHLLRLRYTASLYSSISGSSTVMVGVYPLPVGNPKNFRSGPLIRTLLATAGSVSAGTTLHGGVSATIQGLRSEWIATTTSGGQRSSFGVLVLDGHVVYEVLVTGPATTADITFHRFLRHFKITNPAGGFTI
ncbi:MAG: hypothetical protein ACYDGN_00065 [Acidimicrobiales bacterium]